MADGAAASIAAPGTPAAAAARRAAARAAPEETIASGSDQVPASRPAWRSSSNTRAPSVTQAQATRTTGRATRFVARTGSLADGPRRARGASGAHRAVVAPRGARRADRGTQLHDGLGEIARTRPAAPRACRPRAAAGAWRASRSNRETPPSRAIDARAVAVERERPRAEGDRRHRGRRVRPEARQLAERRLGPRQLARRAPPPPPAPRGAGCAPARSSRAPTRPPSPRPRWRPPAPPASGTAR